VIFIISWYNNLNKNVFKNDRHHHQMARLTRWSHQNHIINTNVCGGRKEAKNLLSIILSNFKYISNSFNLVYPASHLQPNTLMGFLFKKRKEKPLTTTTKKKKRFIYSNTVFGQGKRQVTNHVTVCVLPSLQLRTFSIIFHVIYHLIGEGGNAISDRLGCSINMQENSNSCLMYFYIDRAIVILFC
jgi:hypothetical protein